MSDHDIPRDAALSQLYRESATAEPPAHLDAAILAAARGEAARTPQARPRAWWRGWLVPVSVAAVAVVSLTLTLQVPREMEQTEREAAPSAPVRPLPGGMSAPAAEQAAPAAADAAVPAASEKARPSLPAASLRRQERAPARATEPRAALSAERAIEHREVFVPEPPSAVGALRSQAESAAPGAAPEAPAPFEAQPPAAPARASAAPSPAAGAAFKAAPPVPDAAQDARKRLAPAMTADEAVPKQQVEPPARPPAQWLEDIRALLRQGRVQEAATELAAFRRAHPDYVLPQDLRVLPLR